MGKPAKYTIRTQASGNKAFWVLIDIGNHYRDTSLTNDIEEVVAKEIAAAGITPDGIIYKDSDGNWDGWDPQANNWVLLQNPNTPEEAIDQYLELTQHLNC